MATSTAQQIATIPVYDYLLAPGDPSLSFPKGLKGRRVTITLTYALSQSASPVTLLDTEPVGVDTDTNGFWQCNLIPNNKISPTGTLYKVEIQGYRSYMINVTDVGVPAIGWQSSAIAVLPPISGGAGYTLPGGTEVLGALKVDGTLEVVGAFAADTNATVGGSLIVGFGQYNGVQLIGGATPGQYVSIVPVGGDTNITLVLGGKGTGGINLIFDNTVLAAQALYSAGNKTGLAVYSQAVPIKLEASLQGQINDVSHDFNIALYVANWTAQGAGHVVGQYSTGDGLFAQVTDNSITNVNIPANAINIWAGGIAGAQATAAGSGGTVTYTALTLTDTSKAWTVNQWAYRYVVVGTTRGYVISNTATVLTISAAGWTTNNGGTSQQVATGTPANGTAYAIPQSNGIGVQVQRNGTGNAIRIQGIAGSGDITGNPGANTDLIFITQAVNGRILGVLSDTGSTTADSIAITITGKTTGSILNVYHATSTWSGDVFIVNAGNSAGAFTGNWFRYQIAGADRVKLTAAGDLSIANASHGVINTGGDLTLQSTTNNVVINAASGAGIFMQFAGTTGAQFTTVGGLNLKAGQALDVLTAGALNIGTATATSIVFGIGNNGFTIDAAGHLISRATGTPATSNLGANVTSVTFTGNDVRGTIAIVMSAGLAANTRVCTATFATSYGATGPKITLVDQTSTAGLAIVNSYVLAQSTGVSFDLAFDQALVAGTYTIDYIVIG